MQATEKKQITEMTNEAFSPEGQTSDCSGTAKPGPEHAWLHRMIGDWQCEGEAATPTGDTAKWETNESVRSIGGLWVIGEGHGKMPGSGEPAITLVTLGFDPVRSKFVGTFVGSMMTHLWVYEGELDEAGTKLTLRAEGPGMPPEMQPTKFQDIVELIDDNTRTLTSVMEKPDGGWQQIMRATYRRIRPE